MDREAILHLDAGVFLGVGQHLPSDFQELNLGFLVRKGGGSALREIQRLLKESSSMGERSCPKSCFHCHTGDLLCGYVPACEPDFHEEFWSFCNSCFHAEYTIAYAEWINKKEHCIKCDYQWVCKGTS